MTANVNSVAAQSMVAVSFFAHGKQICTMQAACTGSVSIAVKVQFASVVLI